MFIELYNFVVIFSLSGQVRAATGTARPPLPPMPNDGICASATWNRNGITVAGGNGVGSALNQLHYPYGLFVNDDDTIYIVDSLNYRVVKWEAGVSSGRLVAGGNEEGNRNNQLSYMTKVVVDKTGTIFICDADNKRVQRWSKNDNYGQTVIANISCIGLALDNKGSLYVSDNEKYRVIKLPDEQVVAGGNGEGSALNQFENPDHIFVDYDQSVFVVDYGNNLVMKWTVDAKEGIVIAGGNGWGNHTNQLAAPTSVVVDHMGTVYVVDRNNHRVMRWFKDSKAGSVIIGGQGWGNETNKLCTPRDLAFDRQGNLYVADAANHRIQMFAIDKSACAKGQC
ncbi:unnamed protein product [Adineta steineri]|uniref:NHL repeat containing protein-like protein n=2 Tax=Adineta steineri TaxID=433720 RepID=A0A819FC11_9BILA|nr:unnamed protein product [Adineta steineri]CAF1405557.1 unnamed protein product [Adineta steineri]CAF3864363.1 unnamed protein product [Adineta steineri]